MKVYWNIDKIRSKVKNGVVCVGSFDGVHKGHVELIKKMNERAKEIHGESVVVTFDPHPRMILKGENRLLITLDQKIELLEKTGVDHLLIIEFTKKFSELEYDDFVKQYLIDAIGTKVIFSGEGHHFGKDKKGSVHVLEDFGLEVHEIERLDNISSTAVRDALQNGNMESAEKMLGRKINS